MTEGTAGLFEFSIARSVPVLSRSELKSLQGHREYPSVSILAPTHRTAPLNRQDPIKVKNLVSRAEPVTTESGSLQPRWWQDRNVGGSQAARRAGRQNGTAVSGG